MKDKKKIAYATGTRADFGLMTPVLKAIEQSKKLTLQVYATGMHLMPEFGETIREVRCLFPDTKRIEAIIPNDTPIGQAAFAARLLPAVTSALTKHRPDFVLLLGDRVEMLLVALACRYLGIPTGHLHGGERSETVDDSARHAISRLASLHFPATRAAAERLKKMGEDAWRIHIVGAPALDTILHVRLPEKEAVCAKLGLDAQKPFLLVIQHPVSEESENAGKQMRETLAAVRTFALPVVVLYPNADAGGARMIAEIEKERGNPLVHIFPNVPHADFLALERAAAVWVGNSSAALIESASFGVPVVNIGGRQQGRERGENVRDIGYNRREIAAAIRSALQDRKGAAHRPLKNPYGNGRAAEHSVRILHALPPSEKLLAKQIAY